MVNATELWQTLDHSIVHYTGLSPATFFTILALAVAFYHVVSGWLKPPPPSPVRTREAEFEAVEPLPPSVQIGEVTEEELGAYDGSDPKKPLLMAIKGQIYDVTQSRMFHGHGGRYALFAGKDASRALAKMSFEEEEILKALEQDNKESKKFVDGWDERMMETYKLMKQVREP